MIEERLRVVQGPRGETPCTVLSQAAGAAQQRVPVLGGAVGARHGAAGAADQGKCGHALHCVLGVGGSTTGESGAGLARTPPKTHPRRCCSSAPLEAAEASLHSKLNLSSKKMGFWAF